MVLPKKASQRSIFCAMHQHHHLSIHTHNVIELKKRKKKQNIFPPVFFSIMFHYDFMEVLISDEKCKQFSICICLCVSKTAVKTHQSHYIYISHSFPLYEIKTLNEIEYRKWNEIFQYGRWCWSDVQRMKRVKINFQSILEHNFTISLSLSLSVHIFFSTIYILISLFIC